MLLRFVYFWRIKEEEEKVSHKDVICIYDIIWRIFIFSLCMHLNITQDFCNFSKIKHMMNCDSCCFFSIQSINGLDWLGRPGVEEAGEEGRGLSARVIHDMQYIDHLDHGV